MKFSTPAEGEWVYPKKRGYRLKCCKCGLVHVFNFKLVKRGNGKAILFQAFRDRRRKK
jgi:hypothetical protein